MNKGIPVDTGRKLNVHKTFRRRPGRLLKVLCTSNLRAVYWGKHIVLINIAEYLRKSDVSENSKVYYRRFLRNGVHEKHYKLIN